MSLVQEMVVFDIAQPQLDRIAGRLLNMPPTFSDNLPFEWDWRCTSSIKRAIGSCQEDTNTIAIVNKRMGTIVKTEGETEEGSSFEEQALNSLKVTFDINTSHSNTSVRFGTEELEAFLKESPNWLNALSKEILDFMFGELYLDPNSSVIELPKNLQDSMTSASVTNIEELKKHIPITLNEANFQRELLYSIQTEPIEDGYIHPGEQVISKALHSFRKNAIYWIQGIFHDNWRHPGVAAAILRLVGRLPAKIADPWAHILVINGIIHPRIEVRDAAIRAIELWDDPRFVDFLSARREEQVPWLAEYFDEVITDLKQKTSDELSC